MTVHSPRRYIELANLTAKDFHTQLAVGIAAIATHVAELVESAQQSETANHPTAARILELIAREEAGKFLILLDAARIPSGEQGRRVSQLRRASNHLAKALYFEMNDLRPATMSEVVRYMTDARKSHYLDGPNGADWIFRNQAIREREDAMYVDFQQTPDGLDWSIPTVEEEDTLRRPVYIGQVYDLIGALAAGGFCHPRGLGVIERVWSDLVPSDGTEDETGTKSPDTHWQEIASANRETLNQLIANAVPCEINDRQRAMIVNSWTFPLHSTPLESIDTKSTIAGAQARAQRAFVWHEAGYGDIASEMWEYGPADEAAAYFDSDQIRAGALRQAREQWISEQRRRFIEEG